MKKITLNGRPVEVSGDEISYENILRLLHGDKTAPHLSVTCRYPDDRKGRMPCAGQSVPLVEGMIVNAYHTGNA